MRPLKKAKETTVRTKHSSNQRNAARGLCLRATVPFPACFPQVPASAKGREGTAVWGEADSFAGSHLLFRPMSRQKLALWGSCRPANPWHPRDIARSIPAKSCMRSHLLHMAFRVGGWDYRRPLPSGFMVLCTSQGTSTREKKKATCVTSRHRENSSKQLIWDGSPISPNLSSVCYFFHLLLVFSKWKNSDPVCFGPSRHGFLKDTVISSHCCPNTVQNKPVHHLETVKAQSVFDIRM